MTEEMSVEMVEKADRDGGLRFSEKKFHKRSANSNVDVTEAEEQKNSRVAELLDTEGGYTGMGEQTVGPKGGGDKENGTGDGCGSGYRIEDFCPDLTDESDWFSMLKNKDLGALCIKDFDNILFESVDEAEKFYSYYAFMVGFSKKRWKLDSKVYDGVETITRRAWACSKQGTCVRKIKGKRDDVYGEDADACEEEGSEGDENDKNRGPRLVKAKKTVGRDRKYSRTNCKAFMAIKLLREKGKYQVTRFVTTHNHNLADIFEKHFLRSNRKVTMQDILEVEALGDANVNTSAAFNYLVQQAGGREFVGFMLKDLYNKLAELRITKTVFGDAEAAMNWLRIRGSEEERFFCRYIRDSKKRLAGLFWRDTHSLLDYQLYGDVVVIDATYKTNVYGMPLVLFVGANNHRATVVFACALVCNEKKAMYDWVLGKFLECMNNVKPKSVVTDGCESMQNAIDKHMPGTKHRLCAWHIGRNVGQNIKETEVQKTLGKLIYTSYSIDEWQSEWDNMVRKHKLENNSWLDSLYEKRKKWAEAFCRGNWYAGICTTQRCEGMNHTCKIILSKFTTLVDFIPRYQRCVGRLRDRVMYDNFKSKNHIREYATHLTDMEEFVFKTFTDDIYLVIRTQMDFEKSFIIDCRIPDWDSQNLMVYVTQYSKRSRRWAVQYIACNAANNVEESYSCSCQLYESDGIPCAHIFCVLKSEGVREYPKSLICERWKKSSGRRPLDKTCYEDQGNGFKPSRFLTLAQAAKRACLNFANTHEGFEKGMAILTKLEEESIQFRFPKKPRLIVEDNENVVRDPVVAQMKGTHRNNDKGDKEESGRRCSACHQTGHNKQRCPSLKDKQNENVDQHMADIPLFENSFGIQRSMSLRCNVRPPTVATARPPAHIQDFDGYRPEINFLPDLNSQVSGSGDPIA
ncbi:protein FAR1-RELATED SEQUENCE 5-like [Argentina anserina]|uniref:protein FAR1-RELATED SEQUENCE 5-like n=1 Tax=Argentina anserina TaxID=57926 RepID=UPI0021766A5E|nr:protein FAR1-RELATED SEQUENCE 5-like [Potentilla anserina]XP_050378193.1 protein FAR1-RELATED SEQUENCE 5-like [Potentilla anserina]